MKTRSNPFLRNLLTITAALLFAGGAHYAQAETRYQWNGSTTASSDWTTTENWSATAGLLTAGPGAFDVSGNYRLNVFNGSGEVLVYSAAQGNTTYANTESSGRGLVISSANPLTAGTMEITGGNFSTFGSSLEDVIGNAAVGTLMVSGGSFTGAGPGTWLGLNSQNISGVSTLTLSGSGSATFTTLKMAGHNSTVNLDGGTLVANQILDVNDMGAPADSLTTFNFNGGTLTAGPGAVNAFMTGLTNAFVESGGAIIDTAGSDITIGQALLAGPSSGGLTKSGIGKLTLTGVNTYTGDTLVQTGNLEILGGSLQFLPTANNTVNSLSGTASSTLTYDGTLHLDLSSAELAHNNTWSLIQLGSFASTPVFGTGFTVTSNLGAFTENIAQSGVWELSVAGAKWTFSESNGSLVYIADFGTWSTFFGLAPGSEAADADGDGLTNYEEYAFGLIPNSGASVNPITIPLDKDSGKFSYTRRKLFLAGLTYSIWFSSDLVDWTQDTGAAEGTPIPSGDNETVEVTLSALPGNPLPAKLFIQVRAN